MQWSQLVTLLVILFAAVSAASIDPTRGKRAINPFLDSVGKRALNPFLDSIGKRSRLPGYRIHKRYFDSLAGQSLGKRSSADGTYEYF